MDDLISRQEAIDAVENCEPGEELFMIESLPSIDAVPVMLYMNHTVDYDEKNDILFVHLSPDNSNSYGEEIDKNIIIMRDMDSNEITGVMLYGFNKYVKKGKKNDTEWKNDNK